MIIAPRFLIGHIGKTGGDSAKLIVQALQLPDVQMISIDSPLKHCTFRQSGQDLCNRELVLSIRRLPAFVLSQLHHRLMDGRLTKLPAPELICRDYMGDFYVRHYTDEGQLKIDRWLRCEHLRADLAAYLARHFELSDEQKALLESASTKSRLSYRHEVGAFLQPDQVRELYDNNPLWADIEREVYGQLWFEERGEDEISS
ncbi:MAG: hypothetical protein HYV60_24415 [Planctomycetia bacterium]|nr:hypothetical protein [Planctomycetia bacterium]